MPRFKTTPMPHQEMAYKFAMRRRGCALFMAMGTGKSKVIVDVAVNMRKCERRTKLALIICPVSVMSVWRTEFAKHSAKKWIVIIGGGNGTATAADAIRRGRIYADSVKADGVAIVINYESSFRCSDEICKRPWDLIVMDESHALRSRTDSLSASKTSLFCSQLHKYARRRIAMTGTPAPNHPMQVYGQLQAAVGDGKRGLPGPTDFYRRFSNAKSDPVALADLTRLISRHAFHISSDAVKLPPVTDVIIDVPLSEVTIKHYRKMQKSGLVEIGEREVAASIPMHIPMRLQQIAAGCFGVGAGWGHEKTRAALDLIDASGDEPVVVFSRFVGPLYSLADHLEHPSMLTGKRNDLAKWQNGEGRVLLAQTKSGGVGVDLTRARYVIYLTTGWDQAEFSQSQARCHRAGQTRPVTRYYLAGIIGDEKTFDHRSLEILGGKTTLQAAVLEALRE